MRRRGILSLALAAGVLAAQDRPHVGFVYPAGAKAGETIVVVIGGQYLEGTSNFNFTGIDIPGRVYSFTRDLDPRTVGQLKNRKEILEARFTNASDAERPQIERQLAQVLQQLAYEEKMPEDPDYARYLRAMQPKKQPNAQLTDRVRLEITVPSNASPGRHELRLGTAVGMSEPLAFWIGDLPEAREREPNDFPGQAVAVSNLPAVLSGQILPGDVDSWRIPAKKGQTLVFAVQARSLVPYLADAVPGWFQAVITLTDARGKEVGYADRFRNNPEPVLVVKIPADGDYVLQIRDSIYRGREDFVYRISAGELPFVTGIFPMGGAARGRTAVELTGVNLPQPRAVIDLAANELGPVILTNFSALLPNPILFHAEALPECAASRGNLAPASAQALALPVIVNGRVEQPGKTVYFKFQGKAGEELIAETYARRLGSPMDTALKLMDPNGRVLATNDDWSDPMAGLQTHYADSFLRCKLPLDGEYLLALRDVQDHAGEAFAYRLRLSPPRPDYRLRLAPSSVKVRRGNTVALDVLLSRIDDFAGPVTLFLSNAPAGFVLGGAVLRSRERNQRITLSAPLNPQTNLLNLDVWGAAVLDGKPVVRRALPAEDMMQAFAYRHFVPSEEFIVALAPRAPAFLAVDQEPGQTARFIPGSNLSLGIRFPGTPAGRRFPVVNLNFELDQPPPGISVAQVVQGDPTNAPRLVLKADPYSAKPGQCGNLIVKAFTVPRPSTNTNARPGNPSLLGVLPAVSFEVVAP